MVWIPFAIFAASSLSAAISDAVAKSSDDPNVRRNAEIARDISKVVANVSSLAIPLASKAPVKPPARIN